MTNEEINEAVTRKLGWDIVPCTSGGFLWKNPDGHKELFPPRYATDIKAAWECFEKMAGTDEPFGLFEPYLFRDKLGESVWVCGVKSSCGWIVKEDADTAPLAICKAFLKLTEESK